MANNEAEELTQELTSADREHLRERAQNSTYFLAKGILGYDQVEEGAHAALCAFLDNEPANRRMVLMPRGFLKSTLCTITNSIKLSLVNPNIRILLQNEVFENAAGFLEEIKNHWTKNVVLRALFPELVPPKIVGPGSDWSQKSASLNRTTIAKESTYTASGSGGSPQSQHFEIVKNDDLIGEKAKESPVNMQSAIRWSDAQLPLLNRLSDRLDYYGTRKTLTDVYAHVMQKYKSRIKVFIREPIENGESIFSKFSLEELQAIMVDTPDLWAYDYMNNPMGEGGFDWSNLYTQYFELYDSDQLVYEDNLTRELRSWKLPELYIVLTVDPNSGKTAAPDKAAIVVHGVSPREQIFVLETWDGRPSPDGLIDQAFKMAVRWNAQRIGIEDAGQQNTLYYFEKHMVEQGRYFDILGTVHDNKEKSTKIRQALDSPLKKHKMFFQRHQLTLVSQVQMHPQLAAHNWDLIDALSQGPQVYQAGMTEAESKADSEAEERVLAIRDRTGYGTPRRRHHDQGYQRG